MTIDSKAHVDAPEQSGRGLMWKKVGYGLGWFSLGLAAAELLAPKKIARALSMEGQENLIRGYGAREAVAGAGLLQSPAHGLRVWNRVAGDAMDLATLHFARKNSPDNKNIWGAIAFVAAATTVDICTAVGLDRRAGKTLPVGR